MTVTTLPVGRVVWHDLMSTDSAASKAFYAELFGWEFRDANLDGGPYQIFTSGDHDQGGIVPLDAGHGMPSHWVAYVNVDDVDATVEKVLALGGQACVPATDIENIGRFAVINDPTGGMLSPFQSFHEQKDPPYPQPAGMFCWDELMTSDVEVAKAFYGELFGWTSETHDAGGGDYHLLNQGERQIGGIMQKPEGAPHPSRWMPYVATDDVYASCEKARALGATIYVEPQEIPGTGHFCVFGDPQGATMALFQS
jgi:predicted enzyme related to lactoylglutathione lyase